MALKVLVVRFGSLGDVILAGAAVRALAEQKGPALNVTFLVKEEYEEVAERFCDDVWTLGPGAEREASGLSELRGMIHRVGFFAAVDLQTSPRSRALLAGHPRVHRWNAARWQRRRWVSLRWTNPKPVRPAWLRFVDAMAPLGVKAELAKPPRFDVDPQEEWDANAMLESWPGGPITFLAPGARWPTKRWPEERFIEVGRRIVAGGGRVLIGGDTSDRTALPMLDRWAQAEPHAHWYEGTLGGLIALVRHCERAITNDTGLMHLAAAAGVRVTSVFGSTHPALGFAPAGDGHRVLCAELSCQPCTLHGRERCPLGHHDCVKRIEVDQALQD